MALPPIILPWQRLAVWVWSLAPRWLGGGGGRGVGFVLLNNVVLKVLKKKKKKKNSSCDQILVQAASLSDLSSCPYCRVQVIIEGC